MADTGNPMFMGTSQAHKRAHWPHLCQACNVKVPALEISFPSRTIFFCRPCADKHLEFAPN